MSFKRVDVVLLSKVKRATRGDLYLNASGILSVCKDSKDYCGEITQYLYFTLPDEEIKVGDWFIAFGEVYKCNHKGRLIQHLDGAFTVEECKKIIAATDPSLDIKSFDKAQRFKLPRPSNSFVNKYMDRFNKNQIIKEVLVEFESEFDALNFGKDVVKINGGGNTIFIKKTKETWSTKEVESICFRAFVKHLGDKDDKIMISDLDAQLEPFNNWFNMVVSDIESELNK